MKKIITLILLSLVLAVPFDAAAKKTKKDQKAKQKTIKVYEKRNSMKKGIRTLHPSGILTQIINYTSLPVIYTYGKKTQVTVEGPEAFLDDVIVMLSNRSVTVKVTGELQRSCVSGLVVRVTDDNIGTLTNFGSGSITADRVDTAGASLQNFGSGSVTVKTLDCTKLQVNLYSSGAITAENVDCTSLTVLSQGSGAVVFGKADTTSVDLLQQGSGVIRVSNIDGTTLKATNSSSGVIDISGDVTSASLMLKGSGIIKAKGLKSVRTITKEIRGSGFITD